MITLTEALTQQFPEGNDWARHALATLGGEFEPETFVHDVSVGWVLRRSPQGDELVDTLFILTNERLGLGQTNGGVGDPRWLPISAILSMNMLENLPYPLDTVEIELTGGLAICVGFTSEFIAALVGVLSAAAESAERAAEPQLADHPVSLGVSEPDLRTLDAAPAQYVEAPVADLAPPPHSETIGHPEGGWDASGTYIPPSVHSPQFEPADWAWNAAATEALVEPESPTAQPVRHEPPTVDPLTDPMSDQRMAPPVMNDSMMSDQRMAPPVMNDPANSAPVVAAPPWTSTAVMWPDAVRGVNYVRGHPNAPRKKKNGVLAFSSRGIGASSHSWDVGVSWDEVERIEIAGPDEVLYTDRLRIDGNSSVIIVTTVAEDRLIYEVRGRRPPSLRSALAPMLNQFETFRDYRLNS